MELLSEFFCHFFDFCLWATIGIDKGKEGHNRFSFLCYKSFLN
ncbi:hypothetical protein RV08_GL001841 [Enterococcus mundtii]|nr:hypothetical protein RV08_GL001841 [Enterococcus mundtii]